VACVRDLQNPPQAVIDGLRAEASRLGFDLSVLKPVAQQGCVYPPV
jgi:hypothetical protein